MEVRTPYVPLYCFLTHFLWHLNKYAKMFVGLLIVYSPCLMLYDTEHLPGNMIISKQILVEENI